MYFYTLKNLHKEVKLYEDYYWSKSDAARRTTIDRFNYVIHSIITSGKFRSEDDSDHQPVYLSSHILKDVLGTREYREVIGRLKDMGYIEVDDSYVSEGISTVSNPARSKSYQLTQKALNKERVKVGVISNSMKKTLKRLRRKLFDPYLDDEEVHGKILNSIISVKFLPDTKVARERLDKYPPESAKGKATKRDFDKLCAYNEYSEIDELIYDLSFHYSESSLVGRVYHPYTSIPRLFRESLMHRDGSKLMEIDLKNAQPLLLGLTYLRIKNTEEQDITDTDKQLIEDLTTGSFYKRLSEVAQQNSNVEISEKFENDYSEFKRLVLGEGLYFNYIPDEDKIKPMEKYLIEAYPDFMSWLREDKAQNGYKRPSITTQQAESNIFIQEVFTEIDDEFCIPVHDSLIIKTTDKDFFLNKLYQIFSTKFNELSKEAIRGLFHKTYYDYS